jgi:hypothetical protein
MFLLQVGIWHMNTAIVTKTDFSVFNNIAYTYENFLVQQMHYLLKHKILQFVFKCLNIHFSAPTCFGPL